MSTLKPRIRAYNIVPGDTVTIVGALRNETTTRPLNWRVKDIVDTERIAATSPTAPGIDIIDERTLILRPIEGRGTYLHTVPRNAQVTLA